MTRRAGCTAAAIVVASLMVCVLVYGNLQERKEWRQAAWRAACENNLKVHNIVLMMFAGEHDGTYPRLQEKPGQLMFRSDDIYPEYLSDLSELSFLTCPAARKSRDKTQPAPEDPKWYFEARDYWYLGYAMIDEQQGAAFLEAYRTQATTGDNVITGDDLTSADGTPIPRLREGVESSFAAGTDNTLSPPEARIPTVVERPGHHEGGANVLFMDGHVEFMKYPGEWPMTEDFMEGLQALDDLRGAGDAVSGTSEGD